MTKLQKLLVSIVNTDIFQMTLRFSLLLTVLDLESEVNYRPGFTLGVTFFKVL